MTARSAMRYLAGYPPALLARVRELIEADRLAASLAARYPDHHAVTDDRLLHHYVDDLRSRFLRHSTPLSKVRYDANLHVVRHALGTHTTIARVQGSKLRTKRELRVASVFRRAPEPFLRMIVVHELAHTKEREHDKAFYALCAHMEPDYAQLEFDVRLWLTSLEIAASAMSAIDAGDDGSQVVPATPPSAEATRPFAATGSSAVRPPGPRGRGRSG